MATAYKVLGQVAPSATTATTIYTVPSATETVISSVSVCNRSGSGATFRLSVRPDGATLANQHYLVYDAALDANDTIVLTLGITMDATDVLEAYASSGNLSFHAYGSEIS
jgi:hypothetical protein